MNNMVNMLELARRLVFIYSPWPDVTISSQYLLFFLAFCLTPFLSLSSSAASYHLGQATWPIGEYGNQREADNNW